MKNKVKHTITNGWFLLGAGLILGAAIVLGIRVTIYKVDEIHYHANFALYINGQKEEFNGLQYYTEVEMCTDKNVIVPSQRAHMHDNVNNVVHVEDHAVTWGDFFSNLGWTLGSTAIISPDGTVYSENSDNKLHFVINGQDYTGLGGIDTRVIKDQDKLLVSFGSLDNITQMQEYKAIPSTAQKYDITKDLKSCSGHGTASMHDRLTHMF